MSGVRIRWGGVAKGAIVLVAALFALQALPGLLRAPQPPPLPADVGLPQVAAEPAPPPELRFEKPPAEKEEVKKPRAARSRVSPAPVPPPPAPPPVRYQPPPAPGPAPPPPPPAPPGDGSEEFAPR